MPFGTACGRLRKQILFKLLKDSGKNVCLRCEKEIETVDELSMDHIKPWLDVSSNLFWDLDNIGFSHTKCNYAASRHGTQAVKSGYKRASKKLRKIGPGGTSWCCRCQKFLLTKNFGSRKGRWNGLDYICRKCRKEIGDVAKREGT